MVDISIVTMDYKPTYNKTTRVYGRYNYHMYIYIYIDRKIIIIVYKPTNLI